MKRTSSGSKHTPNGNRKTTAAEFRAALLGWYDRHRRDLPWRAAPGRRADPYAVWLSEIMLQQTTVPAVKAYFEKFMEKWPTVHDLANAPAEEVMKNWAGLGYYARARNLHACAKAVSGGHKGRFPDHEAGLLDLPGIGPYTSAAIASIAFDVPATVIDGNVERVIARYYAIEEPLPGAKIPIRARAEKLFLPPVPDRPGDFAQAMMDLGATVCTPRSPKCILCPVEAGCAARRRGIQETLPRKREKGARPARKGFVYWITDSKGRVLAETRPANGLLGGMIGLPTSEWGANPEHLKPFPSAVPTGRTVFHTFTHFDLELGIHEGRATKVSPVRNSIWLDPAEAAHAGFPSVFLKVVRLMAKK